MLIASAAGVQGQDRKDVPLTQALLTCSFGVMLFTVLCYLCCGHLMSQVRLMAAAQRVLLA